MIILKASHICTCLSAAMLEASIPLRAHICLHIVILDLLGDILTVISADV